MLCGAQLLLEFTLLWGQIQECIKHLQLPSTFSRNSRRLLDGWTAGSLVIAVIPKCLGKIKPCRFGIVAGRQRD